MGVCHGVCQGGAHGGTEDIPFDVVDDHVSDRDAEDMEAQIEHFRGTHPDNHIAPDAARRCLPGAGGCKGRSTDDFGFGHRLIYGGVRRLSGRRPSCGSAALGVPRRLSRAGRRLPSAHGRCPAAIVWPSTQTIDIFWPLLGTCAHGCAPVCVAACVQRKAVDKSRQQRKSDAQKIHDGWVCTVQCMRDPHAHPIARLHLSRLCVFVCACVCDHIVGGEGASYVDPPHMHMITTSTCEYE